MIFVWRSALIAVTCLPVLAQTAPSAAEIVDRVSKNYANLSRFDLAMTLTATEKSLTGEVQEAVIRMHLQVQGPTKLRMSQESSSGSSKDSALIVADGTNMWSFSPKHNQYIKHPLDQTFADVVKYMPAAVIAAFQAKVDESKFLREESIEVGGTKVDCYVLEIRRSLRGQAVSIWWVDKKRNVVLREDAVKNPLDPNSHESSGIWSTVRLNEPIPDDVFVFTPPVGATQVERIDP